MYIFHDVNRNFDIIRSIHRIGFTYIGSVSVASLITMFTCRSSKTKSKLYRGASAVKTFNRSWHVCAWRQWSTCDYGESYILTYWVLMKAVCQVTDRSDVWMTGWCGSSVRRRLNHHHHHVYHHHQQQQQQQQYHRDVRWCLLKQTTHYITASGRVYSGLRCIQTLDKDNSRKTINRCCRLWPNNQSINQSELP